MTEEQVRAIVREEMQRHESGLPVTISVTDDVKATDMLDARIRVVVSEMARSPVRR